MGHQGSTRLQSGNVTEAENYATVATVILTAVKNGQDPFEFLRVIATLS